MHEVREPMTLSRYVALGDSSTEGIDDPLPDGSFRGWADRVADGLARRNPELLYANLAVRGRLSAEIATEQLPAAVALRPDLATAFAGVNDLLRRSYDADRTEANLLEIMGGLRDAGSVVVTITAADLSAINPIARLVRPRLLDLNERIRAVAAKTGSLVVDVARMPIAGDVRLWSPDRLHGSSAGHERIAHEILFALGPEAAVVSPLRPLGALPVQRPWDHLVWTARHLRPWLTRRAKGVSSGTDRECKYPVMQPWRVA